MSQSFGGKLDLSEDETFARLEDRIERGILQHPQDTIVDTLVVVRWRIAATARALPVLGWIESVELRVVASPTFFLPPYQVVTRAREGEAWCHTVANLFFGLDSMPSNIYDDSGARGKRCFV